MHCEVTNGRPFLEHVPVPQVDFQPQVELTVLRDQHPEAGSKGLSQPRDKLAEAGDVLV